MSAVYSVHAYEEMQTKIKEVRQLLKDIEVQVGKYESLKRVHYGHVGDLGHIEELLGDAYEFIVEAE